MKGYLYILECSNGLYYVGSTTDMGKRFKEHLEGLGANFTRKHFPVKLVYVEEFDRVEDAFQREKQIQGWSRKKKEALILDQPQLLHHFAECKNASHFSNKDNINPSTLNNPSDDYNS